MRLLLIFCLFITSTLAIAREFPPWTAPSHDDVRSPCPALNTLANHGIIPKSGRGLSIRMLQRALGDTYNIGLDVSTIFAIGGLLTSPHPFRGTFDLSDLKKHNFIEHDASLSREDLGISGDAVTFRPDIWAGVIGEFKGMANTTIEAAAAARAKRVAISSSRDTAFIYTRKTKLLSYGETALYLGAFGGLKTGVASVDWINTWFTEERLPIAEGWTPPQTTNNLFRLNILMAKLARATKGSETSQSEKASKKEL